MADSLQEWVDKAVPLGSGRYYALLHSDNAFQSRQQIIATLISIFSKLGFQSREIEVVKHKLEWWRYELEKDHSLHPVMSAFNDSAQVSNARERLQTLLNGYGSLLESGSPSTDSENALFHHDTGATACQLLCETDSDIQSISNVGIALSRMRCFRYLRQHVDNGLLCLPMSSLESAGISPAWLTPDNNNEELQQYLSDTEQSLLQELRHSSDQLELTILDCEQEKRSVYKSLFIYLQLQIKLLQVISRSNETVLNQSVQFTPVRNHWRAFRAAVRFDRIANH